MPLTVSRDRLRNIPPGACHYWCEAKKEITESIACNVERQRQLRATRSHWQEMGPGVRLFRKPLEFEFAS